MTSVNIKNNAHGRGSDSILNNSTVHFAKNVIEPKMH